MKILLVILFTCFVQTSFACNDLINREMKILDADIGTIENPKVTIEVSRKNFERFSKKMGRYEQKIEDTKAAEDKRWEKWQQSHNAYISSAMTGNYVGAAFAQAGCNHYSSSGSPYKWYRDAINELEKKFGSDDIYDYLRKENIMFHKIEAFSAPASKAHVQILNHKEKGRVGYMVHGDSPYKRVVLFGDDCKLKKVTVFYGEPGYLGVAYAATELTKEKCQSEDVEVMKRPRWRPINEPKLRELCARYSELF